MAATRRAYAHRSGCRCGCKTPPDREPGRPDRPPPDIKEDPRGVWLVIRYDDADAGVRPIPNGDVFWASPDIWITGGDQFGNAIAGNPTGVHARVWNLGNFQATPTRVDFSFVDAALGIPWHAPQLIGTAWVSVPPLSTVVADCGTPWIPGESSTHACLLVTCSTVPLDPATVPNNPKLDRHAGQRNVTVVQGEAGQAFDFDLAVWPVLGRVATLQLAATAMIHEPRREVTIPVAGALMRTLMRLERTVAAPEQRLQLRRAMLLAREQVHLREASLAPDELAALIDVKAETVREPRATPMEAQPELENALRITDPIQTTTLEPQRLHVGVSAPETRGDFVVHLWQFENGEVTGGYSIVVKK